jgi:SAM-dependent methyltransferase
VKVETLVACPSCREILADEPGGFTCHACARTYPISSGIVDFRDPTLDDTPQFSLANDNLIARKLSAAFGQTQSYHHLRKVYEAIWLRRRAGDDLASLDLAEIIEKQPSRAISERDLLPVRKSYEDVDRFRRDRGKGLSGYRVALEAGAGRCLAFAGYASRFEHLVIVDLSLARLILARKAAEELRLTNLSFHCANVERLPLAKGIIDFVHSDGVIEHVADPGAMLAEAHRVLRAGGMLSIRSHNRYALGSAGHSRLPLVGFLPRPIQQRVNRQLRDVRLLSHAELRTLARQSFGRQVFIAARPRSRTTLANERGASQTTRYSWLSHRLAHVRHRLVNRVMLGMMPVHVALCFKNWTSPRLEVLSSRNSRRRPPTQDVRVVAAE